MVVVDRVLLDTLPKASLGRGALGFFRKVKVPFRYKAIRGLTGAVNFLDRTVPKGVGIAYDYKFQCDLARQVSDRPHILPEHREMEAYEDDHFRVSSSKFRQMLMSLSVRQEHRQRKAVAKMQQERGVGLDWSIFYLGLHHLRFVY